MPEVEESPFSHVYQSRDWMSSRSVCVDVILQFEHSSPSVILLLDVVVGGLCKYVVVVVLCNVGFLSH